MDRRNHPPAAFWGESLNFWCRLWQVQIEQSMRFWGAFAARIPHPSAAELAAEAEYIKEIRKPAARRAPRVAAKESTVAKPAPARKPGSKPSPAPLH